MLIKTNETFSNAEARSLALGRKLAVRNATIGYKMTSFSSLSVDRRGRDRFHPGGCFQPPLSGGRLVGLRDGGHLQKHQLSTEPWKRSSHLSGADNRRR